MLISKLDDAAQAVAPGDEPRFYDDRGCLAKDAPSLSSSARVFVQIDGGVGWIDAEDAFFAFPTNRRTPMGYGLTAFRTEAEASRADRSGRTLKWAAAVREIADHD
jgi:copper chaperone NosL